MIYKIKEGTIYHNKVLSYINSITKWDYVMLNINDIFDYDIKNSGFYAQLNEINSLKVTIEKVPDDKKKYFDKSGWLLPNNKYYTRWCEFVESLDLYSFDENKLEQLKLSIFKKPVLYLKIETLDLYIETKGLKKVSNQNKEEYLLLKEYYELTDLTKLPY